MWKEELMDKVIRAYGMENRWVVWFCKVCENSANSSDVVELAYEAVNLNAMRCEDDE